MTVISNKQHGFTITELMFAMMFVSFLLIFGVTVIVQSMQIYNKGLSVRLMTQSGRQVTEDVTRSLRYAGNVTVNDATQRMCTGRISYAWNIGEGTTNKYTSGNTTPIRFVQVTDPGGLLCSGTSDIVAANAKEIISANLIVQCFTPSLVESNISGQVRNINFVISTSGDNAPRTTGTLSSSSITCDGTTPIECPPGAEGAFCALNEFNTSVYVRSS